jgi:peroxiredoxin
MIMSERPRIGDKAPDFELEDHNGEKLKLSQFRGKRVMLSFHPLAWTGVCAAQMMSLEDNFERFVELNTVPLGISVDTVPSKKAWAESLGIDNVSLVSDFWPHGGYAKDLGIFREGGGTSERANIIVDEKGEIIFFKVYEISKLPDIQEVISFLKG